MGFSFNTSVKVQTRQKDADGLDSELGLDSYPSRPRRNGLALFGGVVLVVGTLVMLWMNIGFARYAFTGLFWNETSGTVLSARNPSKPLVAFVAADGNSHTFSEDYIILCGHRSLCMMRDFKPGESVPVVYDPMAEQYAYIHDWALTSNVLTWFLQAAVALFFGALIALAFRRKPLNLSFRIGNAPQG